MRLYSIIDLKAAVPVNIFTAPSDAAAVRSFEMLLFSPEDSVFNNSPEDFKLVYVGDFDPYAALTEEDKIRYEVDLLNGNSYSRSFILEKRKQAMEDRKAIFTAGDVKRKKVKDHA